MIYPQNMGSSFVGHPVYGKPELLKTLYNIIVLKMI